MQQIRKSFLKSSLLIGAISLSGINLVSCNNSKKEFIEVGLDNQNNNMVQNHWYSFYTGLKANTISKLIQEVEVFCWQSIIVAEHDNVLNHANLVDKEQNLEFKLYRAVYKYGNYREESKSIEIYSFTNTLEYFFSYEFNRHSEKIIIDTFSVEDLYTDYVDYAGIYYYFTITPVDDEPIKVFYTNANSFESVYGDNIIKSNGCAINYKINRKNEITLIEIKKIKNENANV